MTYLGAVMLALTLVSGFGSAQTTEHPHGEHEQPAHDEMDPSEHTLEDSAEALNIVSVGDATLVLEPLISPDGVLTLGIVSPASAELSLNVTRPSGNTTALEAVPVAMMDERDHHGEGTENHGDGESPSMEAKTSESSVFSLGTVEEGIWRISGTLGGAEIAFPLSVYSASTGTTDVYLALAPSPSLATRGLAEVFVYAFRDGEAVHSAIMVERRMAGMQHSTDDDQLPLTHNHFNERYNETLGYAPMANQRPLNFAMAGTWTVKLMMMGDPAETLSFEILVLDD